MATKKKRSPPMFRVEVPHKADCIALRQKGWHSPWAIVDSGKPFAFTNFYGTSKGSHLWHRIRCNDTACPAILCVRLGDALVALKAPDTDPYPALPFAKARSAR